MGIEVVKETKNEILWEEATPKLEGAVTGHDERVHTLTMIFKMLFPNQFEKLRGDADAILIQGMDIPADDVITIDYTVVNYD